MTRRPSWRRFSMTKVFFPCVISRGAGMYGTPPLIRLPRMPPMKIHCQKRREFLTIQDSGVGRASSQPTMSCCPTYCQPFSCCCKPNPLPPSSSSPVPIRNMQMAPQQATLTLCPHNSLQKTLETQRIQNSIAMADLCFCQPHCHVAPISCDAPVPQIVFLLVNTTPFSDLLDRLRAES